MAARTVVCPECSEKLPYGRLSCPACGALLAAVAGGPARQVAPAPQFVLGSPAPAPAAAPVPTAEEPAASEEPAAPRPRRRWRAKQNGAAADEAAAPVPGPATATSRPAASAKAPAAAAPGAARLAPSKVGAVTLAARLEGSMAPGAAVSPAAASSATPPVLGDWPATLEGPSPWRRDGVQRPHEMGWDESDGYHGSRGGPNGNGAEGTVLPAWAGGPRGAAAAGAAPAASARPVAAAVAGSASAAPPPGAYLPPSGEFSARDSGLARGELVFPGTPRTSAVRAAAVVPGHAADTPAKDEESEPGQVPLLADLPFDAPDSLPSWLVAAGCGAAIAGFLLPWSRAVPFATGFGYFDTWGLATPSHLLVLLMSVGTLALAILPNRIPAWFRSGVAGLVLGGLLLGLVWPYLIDGLGAMVGALAEGAAALLLLIGGVLEVRARHVGDESPV